MKLACERLAELSQVDVVNNRCTKLGEWLRLAKSLQGEESELKNSMPADRRKILEGKRLKLMEKIIELEGYDDKQLASDMANGLSLWEKCRSRMYCRRNC